MQLSSAPAKLVEAWAAAGVKNTIPVPSQIPTTPGAASWTDGFPPLTMLNVASGGVPPAGQDLNGGMFAMSAVDVWMCAGAGFPWDSTFSATIGGYPAGSRVLAATGLGYWLSVVDNNTSNPDTGGAGWTIQGISAVSSVYASTHQSLATGNSKVIFDTVEFDPTGLWDSTNKRFVALYAGKYRVSGAIKLMAPGGQLLATQIWKNGAIAKECFQAPQVSTGNLTLPFEAIIVCAVGDFLEAYMMIPGAAVQAGLTSGSSQPFVFAQATFLGS